MRSRIYGGSSTPCVRSSLLRFRGRSPRCSLSGRRALGPRCSMSLQAVRDIGICVGCVYTQRCAESPIVPNGPRLQILAESRSPVNVNLSLEFAHSLWSTLATWKSDLSNEQRQVILRHASWVSRSLAQSSRCDLHLSLYATTAAFRFGTDGSLTTPATGIMRASVAAPPPKGAVGSPTRRCSFRSHRDRRRRWKRTMLGDSVSWPSTSNVHPANRCEMSDFDSVRVAWQ